MTQRRNIVKFGVLIPTQEEREAQSWIINSYVEKVPSNRSLNTKYQRNQSFYGYFQALWQDVVVISQPIQYEKQQLFVYSNALLQAEYNLICLIKDVGNSTGAFVEGEDVPFVLPRIPFDRFLFRLYNNTTLQIELISQPYDADCDDIALSFEEPSKSANPSATDVPPNPNDPGFDFPSAPYAPPNDSGDTYRPVSTNGTWTVVINYLENEGDRPFTQTATFTAAFEDDPQLSSKPNSPGCPRPRAILISAVDGRELPTPSNCSSFAVGIASKTFS
jgi:hypothetical protein